MNSIIIKTLSEKTPESTQSAITMIDGTEMFQNPNYQQAKTQYEKDGNISAFISTVRPLFEDLLQKKHF